MEEKEMKNILEITRTLQYMKELPRQGFIHHGFKRTEVDSVSAHCHSVAVTCFLIAKSLEKEEKIDIEKVLKFAILHDMGEGVTGDIGHMTKVFAKGAIEEIETKAFESLFKQIPFSKELIELQKEYNEKKCIESHIVKVSDHLDAIAWVTSSTLLSEHAKKVFKKDMERGYEKYKQWNTKLGELFKKMSLILFDQEVMSYQAFGEDFKV